jgi:hypothetical protein
MLAILVAVTTLVTDLMLSAFAVPVRADGPVDTPEATEAAYGRFQLTKPVRLHYCDTYSAVPLLRRRSVHRSFDSHMNCGRSPSST